MMNALKLGYREYVNMEEQGSLPSLWHSLLWKVHFSVFSRINNPWFYSRISIGYNFRIIQEDIFKTESKFEESYIFNSETQYAIIWYRRNIYTSRHKNTNCHLNQKISFITNKPTKRNKFLSGYHYLCDNGRCFLLPTKFQAFTKCLLSDLSQICHIVYLLQCLF